MPVKLDASVEKQKVSFKTLHAAFQQAILDYHKSGDGKPPTLTAEAKELADRLINALLLELTPVTADDAPAAPAVLAPPLLAAITMPYFGATKEARLQAIADLLFQEGLTYGQATATVQTDDGVEVHALGMKEKHALQTTSVTLDDITPDWSPVLIRLDKLQKGLDHPVSIPATWPIHEATPKQIGEWLSTRVYLEHASKEASAEAPKMARAQITVTWTEKDILGPLLHAWTKGLV